MSRYHVLIATLVLMHAVSGAVSAQKAAKSPKSDREVVIGFERVLHSDILKEDRELMIALPDQYVATKDREYPIFIVLDARGNFNATSTMIRNLARARVVPHMIVVGIKNTHRWRDLTPLFWDGMGVPGTGGGDKFVSFLKSELIPYVDSNWRTSGFRVFSGHSLGGLTAMNILFRQPELFDAYIAISPSLEWGDGFMLQRYRKCLDKNPALDKLLHMSIADEQLERINYDRMVNLMEEKTPRGFLWTSEIFEQEDDHMSMRITGLLAGIRWVFRDWRLTSNRIYAMTNDEIETHFVVATHLYKEPRSLGMIEMTDAGYWGIYDSKKAKRAMELFRLAVKKWPDKAYTVSCLGEGLEQLGRLDEALVEVERALRMAKESGVPDLPYYEGIVNRVRGKLGE
jgi:predicted alpha/beta superfamily hydrolase